MNFFERVAPYLAGAGSVLVGMDEDTRGPDDFAGELLIYSSEVIASVGNDQDLPPFPDALSNSVSGRITGVARITLMTVSSVLSIAQFQVNGRAAAILKYVNQALRALLAGATPPTPPASVRG
jgi:hypothetical protein